ncbi:MAG: hypothetical protein ABSC90_08525 [Acidimicrobiales bacterium]|jgi:D-arabinose 1-dehydrogenase-like Zn-dependent alcohol dehydrogenase
MTTATALVEQLRDRVHEVRAMKPFEVTHPGGHIEHVHVDQQYLAHFEGAVHSLAHLAEQVEASVTVYESRKAEQHV